MHKICKKNYFLVILQPKRKKMNCQEEFNEIFKKYYKQLFLFAKRYIDEEEDCHDLVNDVFEDNWLHFEDIRLEAVKSYIYTDLRNKCLDFLRRKQTARKYFDFTLACSEKYDSEEHINELKEREIHIKKVMDSLPSTTKEIFTTCFIEHKKYAEAAEIHGISISTVKKHIVRALKLIREQRKFG